MIDISRRSFLIGTGQVIGAACMVPVLSLEPDQLIATEIPPIELIDPSIRYDIKFISAGEATIRPAVWPSRFSPFAYEISFDQEIHNHSTLPYRSPIPFSRRLQIDLSLHYTEELITIEESMFNHKVYKLALNIPAVVGSRYNNGVSMQLVGDFIVAGFDISKGM